MYYNLSEIAILQQKNKLSNGLTKERKRMITRKYILIDGENVGPNSYTGIEKLTKHDTVAVFNSIFSKNNINWKLLYEIQQKPKKEQPNIIHLNVERKPKANEKDKMDYYMIAHLTKLLTESNNLSNKVKNLFKQSKTEYCIISKDKGFDRYADYFKDIYSVNLFRFDNFHNLHMHYNKKIVKKNVSSNKKTDSSDKNKKSLNKTDDSITTLSNEVKSLNKLVKDLSEKIEGKTLDDSYSDTASKNNLISLSNNLNNLTLDTLISKEKIENNNTLNLNSNNKLDSINILDNNLNDEEDYTNTLEYNDSNIIYLSKFKSFNESNDKMDYITLASTQPNNSIEISKPKKNFKKLNLKKFNDNYNSYPKKKKLLRDGLFIKAIFTKHNLYDKYSKKSLDKFIKDCDSGLINIKTMSIRLNSSFPPGSINDFKPALNEIIKYQIKNDIM